MLCPVTHAYYRPPPRPEVPTPGLSPASLPEIPGGPPVTVEECRKLLGEQVAHLSDKQLQGKIRRFSVLAEIVFTEAQRLHGRQSDRDRRVEP
jgi:hypothetical protein